MTDKNNISDEEMTIKDKFFSLMKKNTGVFSLSAVILEIIFVTMYFIGYHNARSDAVFGIDSATRYPILIVIPILVFIAYKVANAHEKKNFTKGVLYFTMSPMIILGITYLLAFHYLVFIFGGLAAAVLLVFKLATFKSKEEDIQEYLNIDDDGDDGDDIVDVDPSPGDFVIGKMYKRNLDEDGKTPEGEDDYVVTDHLAVLPLHDRFVHLIVLGVTGSGKTSQSLLPMFVQDFASDNFKYENIDVVQLGQIVLEPKGDFAKTAWAIGKMKEPEKRKNYMRFLMDTNNKFDEKLKGLAKLRKSKLDVQNGVPLTEEEEQEYNRLVKLINGPKFDTLTQNEKIDEQGQLDSLIKKKEGVPLSQADKDALGLIEDSMKRLIYIKKNLNKYINTEDFTELNKNSTYALFNYASLLTDILANPGQSDESWEELTKQDPHEIRDVVRLFDPTARDSAYFNPLYGPEETAVATVTTTLLAFMPDSSQFFQNMSKTLIQNALHIAKRVKGNDATLNHVNDLLLNNGKRGEELLNELLRLEGSPAYTLENRDFADYFRNDYYSGINGGRDATKTYEQTSGIRSILTNLLDNNRMRKVLNPPEGVGTSIDFNRILKTGDKVALSTATGASDALGQMLGSFLILQLQDAIFARPGSENTRTPVILYIDEFQDYASSSFEAVLTKGRSYVVSATMATQTLGIVESKAGEGLVSNLQSNARNIIVYPGASADDAKYFVSLFGTTRNTEVSRSVSQAVEDEPTRMEAIKAQLMLNGDDEHGGGPRESISEQSTNDNRFDQTQVMYGPNVYNRNSNGNDAFGDIFFRIIKDKSPQTPSVAKIEYIPYDLKKSTDEIVSSYDSVQSLSDEDLIAVSGDDSNRNEDPLGNEKEHDASKFANEAINSVNKDEVEDAENIRTKDDTLEKSTESGIDIDDSIMEVPDMDAINPDDLNLSDGPDVSDVPDTPDIPDGLELPSSPDDVPEIDSSIPSATPESMGLSDKKKDDKKDDDDSNNTLGSVSFDSGF